MKKARNPARPIRNYPTGAFIGKRRERRLIETLSAYSGSGWLAYELIYGSLSNTVISLKD